MCLCHRYTSISMFSIGSCQMHTATGLLVALFKNTVFLQVTYKNGIVYYCNYVN